ncbi:response regulator transcription factor [Variovorax robiniae]|uniref:Response regulator transcription factor n=1 Tax=Variovorax robiniae TaxID=1836199 RepID=A0ABU8XJW7_9BURK
MVIPASSNDFNTLREMAPTRIGIADDHPVVRQALRQLLRDHEEFTVVGEARSAHEALQLVDSLPLQILVLDLSIPGKCGLDMLASIRVRAPALYVLVFSGYAETQFARKAFREGAHGFVHKGSDPGDLIVALRRLAAGGRYVSAALARQFAIEVSEREVSAPARLSRREFQVLLGIAAGKKPAAIARQLSLSAKTVTLYRAHLLHKLGLTSNAELTYFAIREGLLA